MFVKYILFAVLIIVNIDRQINSQTTCQTVLDLIILLDGSGSIGSAPFAQAKSGMVDLVNRLNVGPQKVHVSILRYASTVEDSYIFNKVGSNQMKDQIVRVINNLQYNGGGTATGEAIQRARNVCDSACRNQEELVPRAVVLFTDGQSNDPNLVRIQSEFLRENTKAIVFAVGIGSGINNAELQLSASTPYSKYVLHLQNYLQLTQVINQITLVACNVPAFNEPGVVYKNEVDKDTYRFYRTNIKGLRSGLGGFMEIAVNITQGNVQVFTSTTEANPTSDNSKRAVVQSHDAKSTTDIYMEYLPPDTQTFYSSFKGMANANQYTFVSRVVDINGAVIG
ncbi:unnamed protein product [Adineta steineri]|uniref:VWFA domain-containing protein n=1 Tax=Adineta steineri TaxID=433720 RepID=A0A819WTJ5_9BILA|nr:unnamed protein product [Adineta steineri]CAF4130297.1 unnamed protein product [Adineta steineri]